MEIKNHPDVGDSVSFLNMHPGLFLDRSARVYPGKVAVVHGNKQYTYQEFDQRVSRLAAALMQSGVSAGDRVAYLVPNTPQMLEGHYGPMRMGSILVAMNTRLSSREIGFIIRHSGAKAVIFDSEYAEIVGEALGGPGIVDVLVEVADNSDASGLFGAIEYEEFLIGAADVQVPQFDHSELNTIAIDYTSGTTGEPKGVEYTGRGAYLNALGQALDAGLSSTSTYLWTLPMFHCNGWCYTWAVTAVGGTHVCLRHVNPDEVFSLVARHSATHMCAAPSVLTMLEASSLTGEGALSGVKIFTGGAPPAPRVMRAMQSMGAELHHLYGLTETYGPSTIAAVQQDWVGMSIEDQARMKSRQGVPVTTLHVGVRVVADDMRDVPTDAETIGEVVARGNTVMTGYYRDPEATASAFQGGWFHTGDLAVVHPDGYIELKDRKKDVIISGGENISSVEVEKMLMEHPAILEACVVGVPDETWGEAPKAFVTLRDGYKVTPIEIINFCRERLAHFKAPREVKFGFLPKTATGKIQKYVLREQEWSGHDRRIG